MSASTRASRVVMGATLTRLHKVTLYLGLHNEISATFQPVECALTNTDNRHGVRLFASVMRTPNLPRAALTEQEQSEQRGRLAAALPTAVPNLLAKLHLKAQLPTEPWFR